LLERGKTRRFRVYRDFREARGLDVQSWHPMLSAVVLLAHLHADRQRDLLRNTPWC
jgi:hypothetical protein